MSTLHPIKTPEDHKAALDRIDQLMDADENTPEAAELEVLAILVDRYEREAFPIEAPSPIDAILFRMEQMRYGQTDLARLLNSRSRASEIMTGSVKRLSISMIRRLHDRWHIPADVLIRDAAIPHASEYRQRPQPERPITPGDRGAPRSRRPLS
jgi:HTH-type transcriptional regulator / antitoxin HigA